jgi:uncharacterized membrane protein YfcA
MGGNAVHGGPFMYLLYFFVSLLASVIGGICGIGGGVIIKPVLDATGTMRVSSICFLSGCTVLSVSVVSVLRNRKSKGLLDIKTSTPLAIGAVIGGLVGKSTFDWLKAVFRNENYLGAVQSGLLILITLGTVLYSINSKKIHTHHVKNVASCCLIGLVLGMVSAFLGIGGGPINLTVLFFFFSMDTKKAVANSLYIIMFSQLASLLQTMIKGTVPPIDLVTLILMLTAGISGGIIGGRINKRISADMVNRLFIGFMIVIIGISVFNMIKFIIG